MWSAACSLDTQCKIAHGAVVTVVCIGKSEKIVGMKQGGLVQCAAYPALCEKLTDEL